MMQGEIRGYQVSEQVGQTLAFYPKYAAVLGAGGNLQFFHTVQARHLNRRAQ